MTSQKRGTFIVRDSKSGRFQFEWRAQNAQISEKGSVTITASDALRSDEAKVQLEAVKRIREASTRKTR